MDFSIFLKEGLEKTVKKKWNYRINSSKGFASGPKSLFTFLSDFNWMRSFITKFRNSSFTRFSNYFQTSQQKASIDIETLKKNRWELEKKKFFLSKRFNCSFNFFKKKRNRLLIFFKGYFSFKNLPKNFRKYSIKIFQGNFLKKEVKDTNRKKRFLEFFKLKKREKLKSLKFFSKKNKQKKKKEKWKNFKSKLQLGLKFQKPFDNETKKGKKIHFILSRKNLILGLNQLDHWKKKLKFQGTKKVSTDSFQITNISPLYFRVDKLEVFPVFLEKKWKFEIKKNHKKMQSFSKNKICLVLAKNDFEKTKKKNFFFNFHHKKKIDFGNRNRSQKKIRRKKKKKLKVFSLFSDKKVQIARDKDCFFCFFCFFKNGIVESFTQIDGLVITHDFFNLTSNGKNQFTENSRDDFFFLFHFLKNLFILFFSENEETKQIFFLDNFFIIIEEFKKLEKKEGFYHPTKKIDKGKIFLGLERLKKKNWYCGIRNFFWEKIDIDFSFLEKFSFLSEFFHINPIDNRFFFEQGHKKNNFEKNKNEIFFENRKPKKAGKNLEKNPLFNQRKSINFLESQIPRRELFSLSHNSVSIWIKKSFRYIVPFFESSNFKRLDETERKIRDLENFLLIFNVFISDSEKNSKKKKKTWQTGPPEFYLFSPSLPEKKSNLTFKIKSKNLEISSRIGFVFVPGKIPIIFFNNQFSNFKSFLLEKFIPLEPIEPISIIWRKFLFSGFLEYKIGTNFFQKKILDVKPRMQFFKKKVLVIGIKMKNILSSMEILVLKKKNLKNLQKKKKKNS